MICGMLYRSLIGVVCLLAVTALTSCSPGITFGSSAMGPADTASPSSPVIAEATPSGRQPDQQTAPQTLSPSQDPVAATGVADDTQNAPSTPVPTPSGEPKNPLTGLRVS